MGDRLAQPPHPRRRAAQGLDRVPRAPGPPAALPRGPLVPRRRRAARHRPGALVTTAGTHAPTRSRLERILRTAGVVLLVLAASATCVLLGRWQYHRHTDRVAQVDLVQTNYDADAVPAADLLGPDLTDPLDPGDVWRSVEVTGTWVAGSGVQLRNRPVNGANASHALALLRTDDGALLVVDRGWWRQTDVVPDGALTVPSGRADVVVRLRAAETADGRTNPEGEVYDVVALDVVQAAFGPDPAAWPAAVATGTLVEDAYGMLASPAPIAPLGALPKPDEDLGNHLSYAFQWWVFALTIPIATVVIGRRSRRDAELEAAQEGALAAGEAPPVAPAPRVRRRPTMAEEEDAILDAAEEERRTAGRTG
ncbi:SURF1 family protein [Miniimonas arenae]|uniref:SURF1-like protein n=1 Tax=Miniimonas arenae TaxID=676201 RepID=A0A5C5BFN9_9MICO|nr:SURF1 family protein [Miniimonas arenae]